MQKVLVTGLSGFIGSEMRKRLEGKYELFALNRRDVAGIPTHRADIGDFEAIRPAFEGKDAVVHLSAGFDTQGWDAVLNANIVGTYNGYEAARQAGVSRVVFASSGKVIAGCEIDEPYKALVEARYEDVPPTWPLITADTPYRPESIYGCTKVWGEVLARYYADTYDISMLCVRICGVPPEDLPPSMENPRRFSDWASPRDAVQILDKCLEAPPDLKFALLFLQGDNKWGYRDIEHARKVVGFVPQDAAEDYR